jgi:hypothetical protein
MLLRLNRAGIKRAILLFNRRARFSSRLIRRAPRTQMLGAAMESGCSRVVGCVTVDEFRAAVWRLRGARTVRRKMSDQRAAKNGSIEIFNGKLRHESSAEEGEEPESTRPRGDNELHAFSSSGV